MSVQHAHEINDDSLEEIVKDTLSLMKFFGY